MTYVAERLRPAWREVTAHLGVPADPRAFRARRVTVAAPRLVDLREVGEQSRLQITARDLPAVPAPPTGCGETGRATTA